jgi:hypothetical protein
MPFNDTPLFVRPARMCLRTGLVGFALLILGGCAVDEDQGAAPAASVTARLEARHTERLELFVARQEHRTDAVRVLGRERARAADELAALSGLSGDQAETDGSPDERYGSLSGDATTWTQGGSDATPAPNSDPQTIARFKAAVAAGRIVLVGAAKGEEITDELIDDRLLRLLLVLSQSHRLTVNSLRISHPANVQDDLGSATPSNHIYGRAADVSAVDGTECKAETRGARYTRLLDNPPPPRSGPCMRLAYEAAAIPGTFAPEEIIYYWRVPGPAGVSLKNHDDHVHLGFRSY